MIRSVLRLFTTESKYDDLLISSRQRADQVMGWMCLFLYCVCLALSFVNNTLSAVLLIGLPTLGLAWWFIWGLAGKLITRIYIGCAFMAFTGLIIHQLNGDIEAHFSAFGLIGVLLFYRDWRSVFSATVFIYLHHLVLGFAQTKGIAIFVFDDVRYWATFAMHVAYFLPFVGMMIYLSVWLRNDAYEKAQMIDLAMNIAQNPFSKTAHPVGTDSPMIEAVSNMKSHMQELIKVLPAPVAVVSIDSDELLSVNEQWQRSFPVDLDKPFSEQRHWKTVDDWLSVRSTLRQSTDDKLSEFESELLSNGGGTRYCELCLLKKRQPDGDIVVVLAQDITTHRHKQQKMSRLAYADALTGLANRARFEKSYRTLVSSDIDFETSETAAIGLALIDLDRFKPVNDRYGHDAGDKVLVEVGQRLSRITHPGDLLARYGGDEFVVLYSNVESPEAMMRIADNYIDVLLEPVQISGGVTVSVGASVGLVYLPLSGKPNIDMAIKIADDALYAAKAAGKNCWKMAKLSEDKHSSHTFQFDSTITDNLSMIGKAADIIEYHVPRRKRA